MLRLSQNLANRRNDPGQGRVLYARYAGRVAKGRNVRRIRALTKEDLYGCRL